MKKWVSHTIDGVLGALILFLVGCQITMMVTKKNNFNVPSLFGKSFMSVATDSMDISKELEASSIKSVTLTRGDYTFTVKEGEEIKKGDGIIISKVDPSSIKQGDVITFYDADVASQFSSYGISVVTHRVIEVVSPKADEGYTFYCYGDNSNAMTCPSGGCQYPNSRNVVPAKNVVGKVISHSTNFGNVLGVVQSTWFIPVAVLAPLTIIAVMSAIDMIKESKKAEKEEEAEVAASLAKAGIDPNDERAVLMFQEKERYKIEIAKTMEKTKEEEKKKMRQEIDKEKKRLKKEMKKEAKNKEGNQR